MKLSVLMITYNHEKYIAQAIESVLMQDVDFEYEIVIGEDCSTDQTREIVLDYQRRYPQRIRLLLHDRNVGMLPNFAETYYACTGEYVAILEGDDYWTSSEKLRKQTTFLDQHPETAICFHTTTFFFEDDSNPSYLFPSGQTRQFTAIEDLLKDNYIQTCSAMYRNKLFGRFPGWFFESLVGDYPFHVLNAAHGNIGFINEVMAAYRIHSGGVWSMQTNKNFVRNAAGWSKLYSNLDCHFDYKYHNIIKRKIYDHELSIYKWFFRKNELWKALKHLLVLTRKYPLLMLTQKINHELGKLHK